MIGHLLEVYYHKIANKLKQPKFESFSILNLNIAQSRFNVAKQIAMI